MRGSALQKSTKAQQGDAVQHGPPALGPRAAFGFALLRDGLVSSDAVVHALSLRSWRRGQLAKAITTQRMMSPPDLAEAMARHWQTGLVDPLTMDPDVRLMERFGLADCLRNGVLPLRVVGGVTLIATANPEEFPRHRDRLMALFGPISMAVATPEAITKTILSLRGKHLGHMAEERVPPDLSCRHLTAGAFVRPALLGVIIALMALTLAPKLVLSALAGWAVLTLILNTALKAAAGLAAATQRPDQPAPLTIMADPTVSLIVALYKESTIAPRLIERLSRLEYPRDLLDVILVVEADDSQTRHALSSLDLPAWMRVLVTPRGRIQTKPRALNFALDHCRGTIVGVYDAEDAPARDQIRRIVDRFHQRPADVACLQGVLDFYNPHTNWLARCFTIEYATWFRLVLPGLLRLGMPIPLGGTTLFFRRSALEAVGGWDAHNVTEDADLGIRLYRHGLRTEWVDTVTMEEANCRPLPWVKQRSRWLKGYMMTWATHMRAPRRLFADLGPWQFAGFQILFLGTLSQFLLAPVMWSFWLVLLGVPHPIAQALPFWAFATMIGVFVASEVTNIAMGILGLRLSGQRLSRAWVPTLHLYFPLGVLAAYKAAWEAVLRPFYWDKTAHGEFDQVSNQRWNDLRNDQPFRRSSPASTRSRVSKARLMCVFKA